MNLLLMIRFSGIIRFSAIPFIVMVILAGCGGSDSGNQLPVMGRKKVVEKKVNGQIQKDTLYHKIPSFRFINQDSQVVTPKTFAGQIYVADFFFTRCQTICPKLARQMHRVYQEFKNNEKVALLSHTIDPRHDTVEVLKAYARKLEVTSGKWHFVRDRQDSIYQMADAYMVSADEDSTAPGGYVHSGAFILVDQNRHIRGYYDGTNPDDVTQLMHDMEWLLEHDTSDNS